MGNNVANSNTAGFKESNVLVATAFECLCSLILGVYRYRLENLPLYVPPGHGLFFLVAVRVADLPLLRRRSALAAALGS